MKSQGKSLAGLLRLLVPFEDQDLVPSSQKPYLVGHPRVHVVADLPALRAELVQLFDHASYVVGPDYGLVLNGLHLPTSWN